MSDSDAPRRFVYAVAYPDADEYEIVSRADMTLAEARREATHLPGKRVIVRRPVGAWETVNALDPDDQDNELDEA